MESLDEIQPTASLVTEAIELARLKRALEEYKAKGVVRNYRLIGNQYEVKFKDTRLGRDYHTAIKLIRKYTHESWQTMKCEDLLKYLDFVKRYHYYDSLETFLSDAKFVERVIEEFLNEGAREIYRDEIFLDYLNPRKSKTKTKEIGSVRYVITTAPSLWVEKYSITTITAEVSFDLTKPRYRKIPAHISHLTTDSKLKEEFKRALEEANRLYEEGERLKKIATLHYMKFEAKKYSAFQRRLDAAFRENVKEFKRVVKEFDFYERRKQLEEIDKKIQELNRKLKKISAEIYAARQKEIKEGVIAFEEGLFESAKKKLSEQKFKELMHREFGVKGYIADASDEWRAFVVLDVQYDMGFGIAPTGTIFLCYSDDNGEKGVIEFDFRIRDKWNYTIEDAEAAIFGVDVGSIREHVVARQGDVLVLKDSKSNFDNAKEAKELIIRETHVLTSEKPFKVSKAMTPYEQEAYLVKLNDTAVLKHNSHKQVLLEKGIYLIVTARRDLRTPVID